MFLKIYLAKQGLNTKEETTKLEFNSEKRFAFVSLWVFYLPLCLCTTHRSIRGDQKEVWDSLELELETGVSCRVGAGG